MPKSKKRKTAHHNSSNRNGLSHAEIWDDSALIRSWNDAVAEYEYYHSIHARGEDVEEVLRQAEAAEDAESAANVRALWGEGDAKQEISQDDDNEDDEIEDGEVDESEEAIATPNLKGTSDAHRTIVSDKLGPSEPVTTSHGPDLTSQVQQSMNTKANSPHISPPHLPKEAEPVPHGEPTLTSASVDQTLENIKMAYYWAGYYSGLYEGQRQAQAQAPTE